MSSEDHIPSDAPPSYDAATSSSTRSKANNSSHLTVPGSSTQNGLTAAQRRSMEDEHRPLPKGWVRTYDVNSSHQFFVDTTKDPPRSIWHHPYDDEEYLATLPSEERERIQEESMHRGAKASRDDMIAAQSDDDEDDENIPSELPPRNGAKGKQPDNRSFGRKWKDKVTGTTHEQRAAERKQRAEQERKAYEQQQRIRGAMVQAERTGQPVLLGKDREGKDVYINPPSYYGGGYGYRGGYGGYGYGGYGGGSYTSGNARYIQPSGPYNRPYGYGYGGGYGLPLAGGLAGGLLLGSLFAF